MLLTNRHSTRFSMSTSSGATSLKLFNLDSFLSLMKIKMYVYLFKEWPAEEGCRERIKSLYTCTLLEYNSVRLSATGYNL